MRRQPKVEVPKYPDLRFETPLWSSGIKAIAGLDEAGRGAWAGPVSAAAVAVTVSTRPLVMGALAVVLLGPAIAGGAEITHAMLTDARWPASRWLGARATPGDTLGFFGRPHQLPHIPAGVHAQALHDDGDARSRLLQLRPRWVIVAPDYFADPHRERSIFLPAHTHLPGAIRSTSGP